MGNATTRSLFKRSLTAAAVLAALAAGTPAARAATLMVSPTSGQLSLDGGMTWATQVVFNGATIKGGEVADGMRVFRVVGDFNVNANDTVLPQEQGSAYGVRFVVGNNANLRGTFNFSAQGGTGVAGGGAGGGAGTPVAIGNLSGTVAGGVGGKGGAPGDNRSAIFGYDPFLTGEWYNSQGGGTGHDGTDGLFGKAGVKGANGVAGGRGGAGGTGLNNWASAAGQGGAGGAGGTGGAAGSGTAFAGTRGEGGSGYRLEYDGSTLSDKSFVNTIWHDERSGTAGAAGSNGGAGTGGQGGQAGTRAGNVPVSTIGSFTAIRQSAIIMYGGNGGGGGGAGGTGGQGGSGASGGGGGGGGGSGGYNYCDSFCGIKIDGSRWTGQGGRTGGDGGQGGSGGQGGAGARGDWGVEGGGGGGALMIEVRGTAYVGGSLSVAGASQGAVSEDRYAFDPGQPGGTGGTGGVGGALNNGGSGGHGGAGGTGGNGGNAGSGGAAGAGSGGTIRISASVMTGPGAALNMSGGGTGTATATAGLAYLGSNTTTAPTVASVRGIALRVVSDGSGNNIGTVGDNPYTATALHINTPIGPMTFAGPPQATPYLTDDLVHMSNRDTIGLQGGAALYGKLQANGIGAGSPLRSFVNGVDAAAPGDAFLAMGRVHQLNMGGTLSTDFAGADLVVIVNLGTTVLTDTMMRIGLDSRPGFNPFMQALGASGYLHEAEFGGTGAGTFSLAPGEVWVTAFMADDAGNYPYTSFAVSALGEEWRGALANGDWAYLTAAVPEPASVWLLMLGTGVVAWRRLRVARVA